MNKKTSDGIKITGRVRATIRDAKTGRAKKRIPWSKNVITIVGKAAVARRFGGVALYANEGEATYGAVGDGTNTPTENDTVMQNEIARKQIANAALVAAQTVEIEVFFTSTEANGYITKFALFGEAASGAADSGTMMEYVDFAVPFTKVSNETLTIEIQITVS